MDTTSLIYKVLEGKADDTERQALREWIGESNANKSEFEDIKLLWQTPGEDYIGNFYDGLRQIKSRIGIRIRERNRHATRIWLTIGLSALLAHACLFFAASIREKRPTFMEFKDIPLSEVVDALNHAYNIKIETETTPTCRFTGTFYNILEGKEAILTLTKALNLKCKQLQNGHYVLTGC